jgi:hypothetical protein
MPISHLKKMQSLSKSSTSRKLADHQYKVEEGYVSPVSRRASATPKTSTYEGIHESAFETPMYSGQTPTGPRLTGNKTTGETA